MPFMCFTAELTSLASFGHFDDSVVFTLNLLQKCIMGVTWSYHLFLLRCYKIYECGITELYHARRS